MAADMNTMATEDTGSNTSKTRQCRVPFWHAPPWHTPVKPAQDTRNSKGIEMRHPFKQHNCGLPRTCTVTDQRKTVSRSAAKGMRLNALKLFQRKRGRLACTWKHDCNNRHPSLSCCDKTSFFHLTWQTFHASWQTFHAREVTLGFSTHAFHLI